MQWHRRIKLQRLREFVRSEYDHACLRSCRSRALHEGLKVAATSDLMLAFVDFFLVEMKSELIFLLAFIKGFLSSCFLEEMEVTWLLSHFKVIILSLVS
ncbi:unnamed protein product [Camellia sinensis]